jgi:hypothetical protein
MSERNWKNILNSGCVRMCKEVFFPYMNILSFVITEYNHENLGEYGRITSGSESRIFRILSCFVAWKLNIELKSTFLCSVFF